MNPTLQTRAENLRQMWEDAFDFRDWQTIDWVDEELSRDSELLDAFRALRPKDDD